MVRTALVASTLVLAAADFDNFKRKYGKSYNSVDHEASHRATYEANMRRNDEMNAQNLGFTVGENQFSDLTQEQYRVAAGLGFISGEDLHHGLPMLTQHVHKGETLAAEVNWVTAGAVTPIKDQGQCGSCWAFSTTGSVEGAWQVSTGKLVSASEQQLVDCETTYSAGCGGGSMAGAMLYLSGTSVATEASYPYHATDGTCKTSYTDAIAQGGVTGYAQVGGRRGATVTDMQSAVQQQPVSIAIEADQYSFQAYSGGILSSGCGTRLDHGVLAVGYGTENGQNYWLVKNSWGTSWGDKGYIKISSDSNVCGVLNQPVYTTVSGAVAVEEKKEVEITLPWLTEGCTNKGHCGLAYQTCCLGFQADGYPCGCKLSDAGTGLAIGDCGDCGAAYTLCCAAYAADGYPCTCDVTDGGVQV